MKRWRYPWPVYAEALRAHLAREGALAAWLFLVRWGLANEGVDFISRGWRLSIVGWDRTTTESLRVELSRVGAL